MDQLRRILDVGRWDVAGAPLWAWTAMAVAAIAAWAGLLALRRTVRRRLAAEGPEPRGHVRLILAELAGRTWGVALLAAAFWAGSSVPGLPARVPALARSAVVLAGILQLGLWANGVLGLWLQRRLHAPGDGPRSTAVLMLGFAGRLTVWTLVLLLSLANLGVDVTALIAGLGVGGIAVALAVQNVLGDLFGSVAIALDKPFEIGDFIIVGDLMGTVEHIGLKTTRVRSLFGEQIVFSNSDLLSSRIRNYKRMKERRVVFSLGITYDTPPDKVEAVPAMLRRIVEGQADVRFDRAHFQKYGEWSLDFEVVYFVLTPDYNLYMDRQQAINLDILRGFEAAGIAFAFPTRTVHVEPGVPAVPAARL